VKKMFFAMVNTVIARVGFISNMVNKIAVNQLVNAGRSRPHPWSTKHDYISWSGLTDRHYNARLLPVDLTFPKAGEEALGTPRPPTNGVVDLFRSASEQRVGKKSTCLFPAFAQYLTDGFIRTLLKNDDTQSRRDQTTSNHDIDLSQLYGRTNEQTAALRLGDETPGRRGRLKSQMIGTEEWSPWLFTRDGAAIVAEFVVLDEPLGLDHATSTSKLTLFAVGGDRVNASPQTAMINTLFLREHNRVAKIIEAANPTWNDERVFETTRNVVIVEFIKIVVEDYINHINTSGIKLQLLPSVAWDAKWNRPNWITAEFSLLYRWHSLVPQKMDWGGKSYDGTETLLNNAALLERGLASGFVDVSANRATELGLGNSASFVVPAERKAVEQARFNRIASYASYCRAMKQSVPSTFTALVGTSNDSGEMARRTALAAELQKLYGTVDNMEFYVGLFAEPTDANGPLPRLINAMVAMDAFSQALTNPLLSEHIWGDPTNKRAAFTSEGIDAIERTSTLKDVLERNSSGLVDRYVGLTQKDWKRR
jgi:prostaglandin-endoperoxide synthase 2